MSIHGCAHSYCHPTCCSVAGVASAAFINGLVRRVLDSFDDKVKLRKQYEKLMLEATTYEQWRGLAEQLAELQAVTASGVKVVQQPHLYDRKLLQEKTHHLKHLRSVANVKDIVFALRLDLIRNVANIANRLVVVL